MKKTKHLDILVYKGETMDNILNYEPLVYSIINQYKNFDKEDLYQVAMMELSKAQKKYDKSFNVKFSTYAYLYILGGIKKYIRESKIIKVSKDYIKLNQSVEKAKEVMRQRLKREPTITEVSLFLEIDEDKIYDAQMASQNIKSLDYYYEDESTDLYNYIKTEEKSLDPYFLDLKDAIMNLDEEERRIINARYFEDLTQTEVSKELGMSQVQVSRKETKILQKLKCSL